MHPIIDGEEALKLKGESPLIAHSEYDESHFCTLYGDGICNFKYLYKHQHTSENYSFC